MPTSVELNDAFSAFAERPPERPRMAETPVYMPSGADHISRPRAPGRQGATGCALPAVPPPHPQGEQMSKTIPIRIRKGQVVDALVDREDYDRLASFRWFFPTGKVAPVRIATVGGRKTSVTLARDVMGLPTGDPRVVRRINTEGRDYRRANLVVCRDARDAACRSRAQRARPWRR
jgi:hypothetical protein